MHRADYEEHAFTGSAQSEPLPENRTATAVLVVLHYACPILLLFFFLLAFTLRSILTADNDTSNTNDPPGSPTGPGGKALPKLDPLRGTRKKDYQEDISRPRKLAFQWLSAIAALTFIANAINVIAHTIWASRDKVDWWCGQDFVVRSPRIPLRELC